MTLPVSTILAITFTMLLTLALPIGLMLCFRKRGGKWLTFADGAVVFFLFAMVLEQIFHSIVLKSPLGAVLQGNIWLYALYGGLAAALFEETGRLTAFKLLLQYQTQPVAALAYGAGHGGCEAILITGMTMLNNLVLLMTLSAGKTVSPELAAAGEQLLAVPFTIFLWAGFERVAAVVFHIALSVFVFASVRQPGKHWLFPAAILLHFLMDFMAVAGSVYLSVAGLELAAAAVAGLTAVLAARIYKNLPFSPQKP